MKYYEVHTDYDPVHREYSLEDCYDWLGLDEEDEDNDFAIYEIESKLIEAKGSYKDD